jgi:penicillin-binding protein 2
MGISPIHSFLSRFGYGEKNILDLYGENAGLLPSNQWKKSKYGEPWYPGDSVNVGIGQGFMVATPLQIATATTALANRGEWLAPRMAKTVSGDVIEWPEDKLVSKRITLRREADWQRMVNSMKKVITDDQGTARRLQGTSYDIAGKTGTGQVFSLQDDEEYEADKLAKKLHDHALFIGFAPSKEPDIAIFAIFENGGSSSKPADLSKKLFDAYILGKYPRKYNYLKVGSNE